MPVSPRRMHGWCRALLGQDAEAPRLTLKQYLDDIPRLDSLADLPAGTPVLVRGDVDAKPGKKVGEGDVRLVSMVDTLRFGQERGWKQIVFGHIGRKPEGSLDKVAARLGEILQCDVPLLGDWLDEGTTTIKGHVVDRINSAGNGTIMMLENTRRYAVERALWIDGPDELAELLDNLPNVAEQLAKVADEFASRVARVYVNEAFSAGSLDTSTTIVPAAMERVALGKYVAREFDGPLLRCLAAQLVVFSGLKADKLDDMEAMISRGTVRMVLCAGSLAMALLSARARLEGGAFGIGVAEHPDHADKPYFVPPDRIEQARRMLEAGKEKGIEFVLPVDFVLSDGRVVEQLAPTDQQLDVGPKTIAHFAQKVGDFIAAFGESSGSQPSAAFYNGVFGKFEEQPFAEGTRQFIPELKRMKDAGIEVYVGGGEGGAALEKYGRPDWVTHCFTAGGTVLNALGSNPVPYLVALRMAAKKA
jgi:phosphoglycerate kinase